MGESGRRIVGRFGRPRRDAASGWFGGSYAGRVGINGIGRLGWDAASGWFGSNGIGRHRWHAASGWFGGNEIGRHRWHAASGWFGGNGIGRHGRNGDRWRFERTRLGGRRIGQFERTRFGSIGEIGRVGCDAASHTSGNASCIKPGNGSRCFERFGKAAVDGSRAHVAIGCVQTAHVTDEIADAIAQGVECRARRGVSALFGIGRPRRLEGGMLNVFRVVYRFRSIRRYDGKVCRPSRYAIARRRAGGHQVTARRALARRTTPPKLDNGASASLFRRSRTTRRCLARVDRTDRRSRRGALEHRRRDVARVFVARRPKRWANRRLFGSRQKTSKFIESGGIICAIYRYRISKRSTI